MKKVISLILSMMLIVSLISVSFSTTSAATDNTNIYFQLPEEQWGVTAGKTSNVYCHIYPIYGDDDFTTSSWQSKSEKCTYNEETGLYSYDVLAKKGGFKDGADYVVTFSTTAGTKCQTCAVTVAAECYGDTIVCTGGQIENTEDSTKMDYIANWVSETNSIMFGPKASITSTGKLIGTSAPAHQTNAAEMLVANFLHSWAVINYSIITPEIVQYDCLILQVDPYSVYELYKSTYASELLDPETFPSTANLDTIANLLLSSVDLTYPVGSIAVKSQSNIFPTLTQQFNENTDLITVKYYLDTDKSILNAQWSLTYDANKLLYLAENNRVDNNYNFMPQISEGAMYNTTQPGTIKGNCSNLKLYTLNSQKPFIQVTFKPISNTNIGETAVNLNIETLTLSERDKETGLDDESQEDIIVNNGIEMSHATQITTQTTIINGSGDLPFDSNSIIYFELPYEWGQISGTKLPVYCEINSLYGDDTFDGHSWQSKYQKCTYNSNTGLYSFNIGINVGCLKPGADYQAVFSISSYPYSKTYPITLSTECYGHTVYSTGNKLYDIDNTITSEARWKNVAIDKKYGPLKQFTIDGEPIGSKYLVNAPREFGVAQLIHRWNETTQNSITHDVVQNACIDYNVTPINVYNYYVNSYYNTVASQSVPSLEKVRQLLGIKYSDVINTVAGISLLSLPNKLSYHKDTETFDASGCSILVTYITGYTEVLEITDNSAFSGFDNSQRGDKTVTLNCFGKQISFTVNIYGEVAAESVKLDKTELIMNINSTAKLNIGVLPMDTTDVVTWKSNNISVATVDGNGNIKAVGCGTAIVKATAGEASATCTIVVKNLVTSVSLYLHNMTIQAQNTYQISARVYPSYADEPTLEWTSSDTSVATVDDKGVVTGLSKGTAIITAKATDGSEKSDTCTVTVTNTVYFVNGTESFESPHNYENNCTDYWVYTSENADVISLTFNKLTNVEEKFDYINVFDLNNNLVGKYTGNELAGKQIVVVGNKISIQLLSDDSSSVYGFKVDNVQGCKYGDVNLDGEITISDATDLQMYIADMVNFDDTKTLLSDTNGDGEISIADVSNLQLYLAGIISKIR